MEQQRRKMRDLARPRVSKPARCRGSKPGVARGYTRGQSARAVLVVSDQASPRWRLTPWPSRKETVIIPGGETGSFWGGGHPGVLLLLMQALLAETLLLQPQGIAVNSPPPSLRCFTDEDARRRGLCVEAEESFRSRNRGQG